jgi:Transglycosylase SLT domain/D-alanyl-D-alanine carboxypeptidase/Putative Flp pilus-assembly TadE/G-like
MRDRDRQRTDSERAQVLVLLPAAALVLMLAVGVLSGFGRALLERGRYQRAADLAAVSGARSMRDDFARLFAPPLDSRGHPNPFHLEKDRYLERARTAAAEAARRNGAKVTAEDVQFPDTTSFAPTRVRVAVVGDVPVHVAARSSRLAVKATAEADIGVGSLDGLSRGDGGGYSGPFAYRQGKPMRPDVALAFDRMESAARRDGVTLIINSAYRSDQEQARLYARHPDSRWVAPPGHSLHRNGTELDLGPASAYSWLAHNAERFHFARRYQWEPWHYGYTLNPRSTQERVPIGDVRVGDWRSAVPSFVPAGYTEPIRRAASRWSVSAALLAAQLYVESNFNPFAVSPAGARGIAQFMPGTARSYGLADPEDAPAAIDAQARLMRDLLRRFASIALALAAYNAGPGAVERCGCVPPYPETQAYVARILGLMGGAAGLPEGTELEVRLVS